MRGRARPPTCEPDGSAYIRSPSASASRNSPHCRDRPAARRRSRTFIVNPENIQCRKPRSVGRRERGEDSSPRLSHIGYTVTDFSIHYPQVAPKAQGHRARSTRSFAHRQGVPLRLKRRWHTACPHTTGGCQIGSAASRVRPHPPLALPSAAAAASYRSAAVRARRRCCAWSPALTSHADARASPARWKCDATDRGRGAATAPAPRRFGDAHTPARGGNPLVELPRGSARARTGTRSTVRGRHRAAVPPSARSMTAERTSPHPSAATVAQSASGTSCPITAATASSAAPPLQPRQPPSITCRSSAGTVPARVRRAIQPSPWRAQHLALLKCPQQFAR